MHTCRVVGVALGVALGGVYTAMYSCITIVDCIHLTCSYTQANGEEPTNSTDTSVKSASKVYYYFNLLPTLYVHTGA